MNALLGFVYMRARQYDLAIKACREAIELDSNSPFGHWLLARSLDATDQITEALSESEIAAKLSGSSSPYLGHLGYAMARAGDAAGASEVVESLREREKNQYVSPFEFVTIYAAFGETDLAFEYLEKSYQERTPRLSGELWDRPFDGLRADPRFKELMLRIGHRK
jgi:tetratricopeptide (TPR) repeat protein